MIESERKKAHKEGPAWSKWQRLKASLFGREEARHAEELTPEPPPAALEIEPGPAAAVPEPREDTPPAALFSSLSPDSPAPMEKGDREKKGRSGSERRQMGKAISARLTPSEYTAIAEKAARAGLSLSAYARACLLGDPGLRAKRAPPINRALLAETLAALNRVGNNVNQIAHNLNAGGHPDRAAIAEAKAELSDCLKAILAALGRSTE